MSDKSSKSFSSLLDVIQFSGQGLVPAVIQDAKTRQVLTLCYLNRDALARSLDERTVYVYRRSQQRLMLKGETSGHVQRIVRVSVDCEGKSLLIEVNQKVACCHDGYFSCYYRKVGRASTLSVTGKRVFDPVKVYHKQ
jgi:phosphoribosyl-AMP cyclohydrolase